MISDYLALLCLLGIALGRSCVQLFVDAPTSHKSTARYVISPHPFPKPSLGPFASFCEYVHVPASFRAYDVLLVSASLHAYMCVQQVYHLEHA